VFKKMNKMLISLTARSQINVDLVVIIMSIVILAMSIAVVLFIAGPSLKDKGGCNNNCICEDSLVDPSLKGTENDRHETKYNCFPPFSNDCCKDDDENVFDCVDINKISPMDYDPACFDTVTIFDNDGVCSYFEPCDSIDCSNKDNKGASRCYPTD